MIVQVIVPQGTTVDVQHTPVDPPPPPPPPGGNALADLSATIAPGSWGELVAENINVSLCDSISQNTRLPFHYCNSAPWDGSGICFIGMDHGGSPGFSRYDAPTNRWQDRILSPGSHGYNFTAADGATIYRMISGGLTADPTYNWSRPGGLYKWNGTGLDYFGEAGREGYVANEFLQQTIAHHPICYWPGRGVFCWSGNTGAAYLQNPQTKTWTMLGQVNSSGVYHCVVAYSPIHDCMVFGGGNDNGTGNAVKLWRIDSDATITTMPVAPFAIGIYNGANFNIGADGNGYALGFGQHAKLDLSNDTWSALPTPPADMLYPNDHDAVFSCGTPYCIVYVTGRSVNGALNCRMRVYKP